MDTPCRYCHGSRRLTVEGAQGILTYSCTSCNGTGLDGDPRLLMAFMLTSFVGTLVAAALFVYHLVQ